MARVLDGLFYNRKTRSPACLPPQPAFIKIGLCNLKSRLSKTNQSYFTFLSPEAHLFIQRFNLFPFFHTNMSHMTVEEEVQMEKREMPEKKNQETVEKKDQATQDKNAQEETPVLQPMAEELVTEIELILGYEFVEKMLLAEAFTHASFNKRTKKTGKSYERLEFMGDAVLSCLIARELFHSYQDLTPGRLTHLRAANVDTERLARIAIKNDLHRFIRHKAPQLDGQIEEFMASMPQYPIHSNGLLDPPKALADIIESVIGAVLIDSNNCLETVWKTFRKLAEPLINLETLGRHPVSELYELCQKNKMHLSFDKNTWRETMTVEAFVDGNLYGSGTCTHKKEIAQNRAAKAAVDRLKLTLEKTQISSR